jgi:hypothetical protein
MHCIWHYVYGYTKTRASKRNTGIRTHDMRLPWELIQNSKQKIYVYIRIVLCDARLLGLHFYFVINNTLFVMMMMMIIIIIIIHTF